MKKIYLSILLLLFLLSPSFGQDVTTVEAKTDSIADNLDLEAVASIFGEAKDLEDFEKKLNDPELQISNLDLSNDGNVDYLRVVETSEEETHVIVIQAVIGKDEYQDVATIDVEEDEKGNKTVQVVGDVYMYGPNYIIEPVYVAPPPVVLFLFAPVYVAYRSPYYWGYYPPYFRPWPPRPIYAYHRHVHVHVNVHNTYRRTNVRYSSRSVHIQKNVSRNAYKTRYPNRSYNNRHSNSVNTRNASRTRNTNKSTNRQVQKDWKPSSDRNKSNNRSTQAKPKTRQAQPKQNNRAKSQTQQRQQSKPRSTQQQRPKQQRSKPIRSPRGRRR